MDHSMSRRDGTTTKVFVGSLPAAATTSDLHKLFEPYGKIVECDIANRCGFVHLEDKDLAEKAIQDLHNTSFLGGRISVERGRVKPPKSRRRERETVRSGGRDRGPYSREEDYARGARNGMDVGYAGSGREYEYDRYDRGAAPRYSEYDIYADRKPAYGERDRDYLDDRRAYPNGYDRPYDYGASRAAYDDRRLVYPDPVDDRRPPGTEHRPLDPSGSRAYDRSSSASDMYSRRVDSTSKSLSVYGDRSAAYGGYSTTADGYSSAAYAASSLGYATSSAVPGYSSAAAYGTAYDPAPGGMPSAYSNGSASYGGGATAYNPAPVGYATTASYATGYPAAGGAAAYGTSQPMDYGGAASGYGDPYAASRAAYDATYSGTTRSLSSGSGARERDLRRDLPPGTERRY